MSHTTSEFFPRWNACSRLMLAMFMAALALLGCEKQQELSGPDPRKGFIAFVGAGSQDPLWPVLQSGARRYLARTSGISIRLFQPADSTPAAQLAVLDQIGQYPDLRGLCIHPANAAAIANSLQRLYVRGILIVSMLEPVPEGVRVAHVGLDDNAVGRSLAQATAEAFGHEGATIMVLHAGSRHPVYGPRHNAFFEEIARHSHIEVLADLDCKGDPNEARQIIRDRAVRFPRLTAWVAMDDWPLAGNTDPNQVFDKGKYITFGGIPKQWNLIRSGRSPFIIAARYDEIAPQALKFCEIALCDPSFRRSYSIPLVTVGPADLPSYQRNWNEWISDSSSSKAAE